MSLILDALKRAERERKLGQAPAPLDEVAAPPPLPESRPQQQRWIAALAVAAALLVAAAALWFRAAGKAEPAAAAPEPAAAAPAVVEPTAPPVEDRASARIEDGDNIASLDDLTGEVPVTTDNDFVPVETDPPANLRAAPVAPGPTLYTPSMAPERTAAQPAAPKPAPATVVAASPPAPGPAPITLDPAPALAAETDATSSAAVPPASHPSAPDTAVHSAPEGQPPAAERPAAATTEVPPAAAAAPPGLRRLKDMPAAYRAEFPPLAVDVHVYNADPQRRFVLVNGKRYREGDPLAEGPRIAEIVADGLVVDWRNERVLYTLNR